VGVVERPVSTSLPVLTRGGRLPSRPKKPPPKPDRHAGAVVRAVPQGRAPVAAEHRGVPRARPAVRPARRGERAGHGRPRTTAPGRRGVHRRHPQPPERQDRAHQPPRRLASAGPLRRAARSRRSTSTPASGGSWARAAGLVPSPLAPRPHPSTGTALSLSGPVVLVEPEPENAQRHVRVFHHPSLGHDSRPSAHFPFRAPTGTRGGERA
jgi:hypothetical protein